LYPKPFFQILEQPVNQIVQTVRPGYPGTAGAVNASARIHLAPVDATMNAAQIVSDTATRSK
jgi:hypothetical protein